ncbi:MAG: GerMN domain-containing protein, partial [Clostridia bacterium]|nr:GerMN domain-containing protein [Clostridia bacterium]
MAGDIYIGPSGFVEQNITEYYSEMYGGGKRSTNTEGKKPVLMYYGDKSGAYIVPEKAQIYTNPSNYSQTAEAVLTKIKNAPANSADLMTVVSNDISLNWIDIRNGRLTMDFSSAPAAPQVKSQSVACAALYYTFKGIYPSINDAVFSINGVPIETEEIQGGVANRDTLSTLVGNAVTLYMPGEDLKTLYPVKKYLRSSSGISVVEILKALEEGAVNSGERELLSPFFEDLSVDNIINARVVNDVAIVNFDTGFYDSVRTMTKEQETVLVYSIVNTLTTREQINRVQFLINNQSFDTINGHIYYTNPLYTNPGIIFKEEEKQ